MTDRSYTVKEIDDLRGCIACGLMLGSYQKRVNWAQDIMASGGVFDALTTCAIELRTQTHMLAGHTAEDLIASEE